MILRLLGGKKVEAILTTERAESSYGLAVLVIDGAAYGRADHAVAGVRFLAGTDQEREAFAEWRGGFRPTEALHCDHDAGCCRRDAGLDCDAPRGA